MQRKTFLTVLGLPVVSKLLAKVKVPGMKNLCKTQADNEGPFYKIGAPQRTQIETDGTPLIIEGRIFRSDDCSTPVPNAVLDIWHCDRSGNYDNEGFKCRGKVTTNEKGQYSFSSIFPPPYGRRPRHIHVKVIAEGFED